MGTATEPASEPNILARTSYVLSTLAKDPRLRTLYREPATATYLITLLTRARGYTEPRHIRLATNLIVGALLSDGGSHNVSAKTLQMLNDLALILKGQTPRHSPPQFTLALRRSVRLEDFRRHAHFLRDVVIQCRPDESESGVDAASARAESRMSFRIEPRQESDSAEPDHIPSEFNPQESDRSVGRTVPEAPKPQEEAIEIETSEVLVVRSARDIASGESFASELEEIPSGDADDDLSFSSPVVEHEGSTIEWTEELDASYQSQPTEQHERRPLPESGQSILISGDISRDAHRYDYQAASAGEADSADLLSQLPGDPFDLPSLGGGTSPIQLPDDAPPGDFYGDIQCPTAVIHGREFDVTVRLQPTPPKQLAVVGPMQRPANSFLLTVQFSAPGFSLATDDSAEFVFQVDRNTPYPERKLTLRSNKFGRDDNWLLREINVLLSCEGQILGYVNRALYVAADDAVADELQTPHYTERLIKLGQSQPLPIDIRHGQAVPDLSIHVTRPVGEACWVWRVVSPRPWLNRNIESKAFTDDSIDRLTGSLAKRIDRDGVAKAYAIVNNIAEQISDIVPQEIKSAMFQAARAVPNRPISILFYGELAQVPWELVRVDDNWTLIADVPPLLGAQARVGRWFERSGPPKRPPVAMTTVSKTVVISGKYDGRKWQELRHAREEADALVQILGAQDHVKRIDADKPTEVSDELHTDDSYEAFHLALHGQMSDRQMRSGLVLPPGDDNDYLEEQDIRTYTTFKKRPFIFLNACQAAGNYAFLDMARGLAEALIVQGAGALVAPIWKVDDAVAKDLALDFYAHVVKGMPVAEALRRQRARFTQQDPRPEYVAYQLYGHPDYQLAYWSIVQEV
jgi:CHAT domain